MYCGFKQSWWKGWETVARADRGSNGHVWWTNVVVWLWHCCWCHGMCQTSFSSTFSDPLFSISHLQPTFPTPTYMKHCPRISFINSSREHSKTTLWRGLKHTSKKAPKEESEKDLGGHRLAVSNQTLSWFISSNSRIVASPLFPKLCHFPEGHKYKQWTGDDSKVLMKVIKNLNFVYF